VALPGLALLSALVLLVAVQPAVGGAAAPAPQVEAGRQIFAERCAKCHGERGQGKVGPPVIGPEHGLWGYQTAQGLYDYVSRTMPFDAIGSLTPEQHWSVVAFVLSENRFLPPGTTLGPANAKGVKIAD
jgi:cytochrome c